MAEKINIQRFVNEKFGIIEAFLMDSEPWFIGKKIAEMLGYKDTDKAIRNHVDEEDKQIVNVSGISSSPPKRRGTSREGNPNMVIINESGMYSLILSSKLPNAKKFKKWVTKEVLPALRKDGLYEDEDFEFLRQLGIEDRNMLTSTIKALKRYCKKVHCIKPKKYCLEGYNLYSTITVLINGMVNLPAENDRNELTKKQLEMLSRCEDKVAKVILLDMTKNKHPDLIFIHVKEALAKRRKKFIEKGLLDDKELVDIFTFKGYFQFLDDMKERISKKKNKE